jgi:hypothetical protein
MQRGGFVRDDTFEGTWKKFILVSFCSQTPIFPQKCRQFNSIRCQNRLKTAGKIVIPGHQELPQA